MNWRLVLIASLGLNALLAAFAVKRAATGTIAIAESTVVEAATPRRSEVRTVTRNVVVTNSLPAVEPAWPRWPDWVSEDWDQYRTNLLAAGCPGVTVHELLRASLLRARFAEQQAVRASVQAVFWDALARHGFDDEEGPIKTASEKLDALDRRYDELSSLVLAGLPRYRDVASARQEQTGRERQFDHLEPEKRRQAAAMVGSYELRRHALVTENQRPEGGLTPEGSKLFDALTAEHTQQLEALLGPEGAAEWRRRTSDHADWASSLRGLEVTPEEMRRIAEWKEQFDVSPPLDERFLARYGSSIPARTETDLKNAEQSLAANIRQLLGEERFALMQHANQQNGGTYVALFDIAERFELPPAVIQQGMDMQQGAHATAEQIRANASLTAAQRREALRAIQQETRQAVEGLLGADAFYTYQRHGGDWINELSALNSGR